MDMLQAIDNLYDIHLTLETFRPWLYKSDSNSLINDFNQSLHKLRKPLNRGFIYDYSTPDDVIEKLINICDYPIDFETRKTRKIEYVQPRQIAQTISRYLFPEKSLAEIGSYFVNSDHSSVLHSIKTVKNLCETDKKYLKNFNDVQEKILGFVYIKF